MKTAEGGILRIPTRRPQADIPESPKKKDKTRKEASWGNNLKRGQALPHSFLAGQRNCPKLENNQEKVGNVT